MICAFVNCMNFYMVGAGMIAIAIGLWLVLRRWKPSRKVEE